MGELIAALVVLMVPVTERCDAAAALDVVRAAAWTSGDRVSLERVYAGRAGERDVARLRSWRERGVSVRGMRTLRARCRPIGATRIEVVERLGPTEAVLPDGSRRALPEDAWDRRILDLAWIGGRWRIAAVS